MGEGAEIQGQGFPSLLKGPFLLMDLQPRTLWSHSGARPQSHKVIWQQALCLCPCNCARLLTGGETLEVRD